jgi:signal transduction histidine kinase
MARLKIDPPVNTLMPLNTAVRLLRIMLSLDLVPSIAGAIYLGLRFGATPGWSALLLTLPTALVWIIMLLPRLDHRLGRYYLPIGLGLTIIAQVVESWLPTFIELPFQIQRFLVGPRASTPLEVRFGEPLFLLLVATVLGAWVYGRRGAWLTAGSAGTLLVIGAVLESFVGRFVVIRGTEGVLTEIQPLAFLLPAIGLRLLLLIVIGTIVGILAEQERNQTQELSIANMKLREQALATDQLATARERNRLARDLHDTLAHSLAGLVVQLQAIDTLVQSEPEAARAELAKAHTLAQEGLQEARGAIRDLRVNPVEDLGLARALEREVIDFSDRAGVQVKMSIAEPKKSIANDVAAEILRIAREAFNNIESHADAQCVDVTLNQQNAQLVLSIADDGRGFEHVDVSDDRFGLTGMRERAEMIGATLKVNSAVGRGTSVELALPL